MNFKEIIANRRDSKIHTPEELITLAQGAADGSVPDYQLSAWLMAAYLNPLTIEETALLTISMADSGERLDLTGVPKPWVDKHSTGGVGDKTSLVLIPILAACGLSVVKMSGRGLGITGGTIDKLMCVPGMTTDLTPSEMVAQAKKIGIALSGQTPDLAPADKALYALRDVTETVASLPLIVSSILSKKIAGGAETVVLDVKCGSGSFNQNIDQATALAKTLKLVGTQAGLTVKTAITDMTQPLGSAVGNALEVREALFILRGDKFSEASERFRSLCIQLAGITLAASGLAPSEQDGQATAEAALSSGRALEKAQEWFRAQGFAGDLKADLNWLPKAAVSLPVLAPLSGYVHEVHADQIGQIVLELGGGRKSKADTIDLSVGVELQFQVGDTVTAGQEIATVHAKSQSEAIHASGRVAGAFEIESSPTNRRALILGRDPE